MQSALPRAGLSVCLTIMLAGTQAADARLFGGFETPTNNRNDKAPTGYLKVGKDVVRAGTPSALNWNIELSDPVEIGPDGEVTPPRECTMKIRILGLVPEVGSNHGHGNNIDGVDSSNPGNAKLEEDSDPAVDDEIRNNGKLSLTTTVWAELYFSSASCDWTQTFGGDSDAVDPTTPVVEKTVQAGETIDFAARAFVSKWLTTVTTTSTTPQLVALRNGDPLPDVLASKKNNKAEYLKPYITKDNRVNIGHRDVLYIFELTATNGSSTGYDLQDLVFLVTFEDVTENDA